MRKDRIWHQGNEMNEVEKCNESDAEAIYNSRQIRHMLGSNNISVKKAVKMMGWNVFSLLNLVNCDESFC